MSRPSEVYVRPLLPEEREWVHRLYQQTTHVGRSSRCHIILLSAQHYSVPRSLLCEQSSKDTVARCIYEFNRSGREGILPQERVGRPATITEEYLGKLLELVESDPRGLQSPFSRWTNELLAAGVSADCRGTTTPLLARKAWRALIPFWSAGTLPCLPVALASLAGNHR